jgi:hypothetical protein
MKTAELTGTSLDYWVARAEGITPTVEVQLEFMPSTNWRQAGPIIEREKIIVAWNAGGWIAGVAAYVESPDGHVSKGSTALIAAMRAFVTSQLGDDLSDDVQLLIDKKRNG